MKANDLVSLVIITRNRARELCTTLERLCVLPELANVIVVDNGSSDDSVRNAKEFPNVRVIEANKNLGATARRVGLEVSTTPYVAFADDDVRWQAGSLARGCELLRRFPKVGVLTAKVMLYDSEVIDPTCLEMARSPLGQDDDSPGPSLIGFLAGASIARRTALLPAMKSFPERLVIGGEEQWIAADLASSGWKMCYADELVVRHYPSPVRNARQRACWQVRSDLWFAWLRRPLRSALRRTLAIIGRSRHSGAGLRPCIGALALLPRLISLRQVVPPHVEAMFRLLEVPDETANLEQDSVSSSPVTELDSGLAPAAVNCHSQSERVVPAGP